MLRNPPSSYRWLKSAIQGRSLRHCSPLSTRHTTIRPNRSTTSPSRGPNPSYSTGTTPGAASGSSLNTYGCGVVRTTSGAVVALTTSARPDSTILLNCRFRLKLHREEQTWRSRRVKCDPPGIAEPHLTHGSPPFARPSGWINWAYKSAVDITRSPLGPRRIPGASEGTGQAGRAACRRSPRAPWPGPRLWSARCSTEGHIR